MINELNKYKFRRIAFKKISRRKYNIPPYLNNAFESEMRFGHQPRLSHHD